MRKLFISISIVIILGVIYITHPQKVYVKLVEIGKAYRENDKLMGSRIFVDLSFKDKISARQLDGNSYLFVNRCNGDKSIEIGYFYNIKSDFIARFLLDINDVNPEIYYKIQQFKCAYIKNSNSYLLKDLRSNTVHFDGITYISQK